jgi:serine/threonine protein kinase
MHPGQTKPFEPGMKLGTRGYTLNASIRQADGHATVVWSGTSPGSLFKRKRPVVIKAIHPDLPTTHWAQAFARLGHEITVLRQLRKKGAKCVPTFIDTDMHYDTPFVVMSPVYGQPLPNEQLPWRLAAGFALRVLPALAQIHEVEIIHGDLKPSNGKVLPNGQVILLDFDNSQCRGRKSRAPRWQTPLTKLDLASTVGMPLDKQQGLIIASPQYASPEQLRDEILTPQSDIYPLSVMLFLWLTGRLPFNSNDKRELRDMHLHMPPPSVSNLVANIPPNLVRLVDNGLAKNPANRPAGQQMMHELSRCAN